MEDTRKWVCGTAWIERNPLTGNWFVFGQKDSFRPYICAAQQLARNLARTVDHYNKTNQIVKFSNDEKIPNWAQ